jgi:hypothetical protein
MRRVRVDYFTGMLVAAMTILFVERSRVARERSRFDPPAL